MSAVIVEFAPAKINLTLCVLGRRPDGYHELESLVVFARDVGDVVRMTPSVRSAFSVIGEFAGDIVGVNLAERAMWLVAETAPDYPSGAVELEKNLPVTSGVGGGSSDAAAVLRAFQRASPQRAALVDWVALARKLGADAPVCFLNEPALMTGVGERLQPVVLPASLHAVLVKPDAPPPPDKTARVFQALDAAGLRDRPQVAPQPAFKNFEDVLAYARARENTLETAATSIMPEISDALSEIRATSGCRIARLSGAGPTCFGLYASRLEADAAANRVTQRRPGWWARTAQLS